MIGDVLPGNDADDGIVGVFQVAADAASESGLQLGALVGTL
jgi:hypothetical protein